MTGMTISLMCLEEAKHFFFLFNMHQFFYWTLKL